MKKILIPSLLLCLLCLMGACGNHKQSADTTGVEQTGGPSADDSAAVVKLTVDYLEALKSKQYDEAVAMLHIIRNDSIFALPEDLVTKTNSQNRMFPVLRYHINDVKFTDPTDCEVYYTVYFFEKAEDDDRPNYMHFGIHPRKVSGIWNLTPLTKEVN